ncbi:hypothetical protein [Algoriphagus aquimarinus]|uniref:hypothetical protein n=1 Tax=Algoriphagus aquimarinus TaxID=237018 RepID=UPI0030DA3E81
MKDRSRRSFDKVFKLMVLELHKSGKSSNEIGRDKVSQGIGSGGDKEACGGL